VARSVALWDPRTALRRLGFLVPPTHALLFPAVRPVVFLLQRLGSRQVANDEEREEDQDEEVEALIEVGERDGILEAKEGEMMRSIVDLDATRVREIMTPRTDIVAVPTTSTVGQARDAVLKAGHSRLPVYRETIDDIVGVLYARDLLRAWEDGAADRPITPYMREAMFVPETLSVADLLSEMRLKTHIALVVDEYGGVAGLITLEDLLEEIVGDIRDEHDLDEEALVRAEADGSWVIDAAAHVEELEQRFGVEFEDRDFDTVGGLVVSHLGRVPEEGERLAIQNLEIEVLQADRRRIRRVRVRAVPAPDRAHAGP
jgi:magnesium and cobalt transporter